ncbi:MAG: serine/threonine-protein kinase [Prosthecobacter sp.]
MNLDPFLSQSQDHGGPQMPTLKAGQRLFNRRYELRQTLGAGGMGVVWLAHDQTEEIDVALKFLPSVLVLQDTEMRRLKEEVRAGKELRHPRLVATYGMEIEDGIAAIIMEFVPGQTVMQKLEEQTRGFFEPEEILSWVKDMTDGLAYLHDEAKRIHRDLKPANVMIDANGRARLMDFGISHRIKEGVSRHSKTHEGAASASSSTLAYASPQQITGKPSAKADDLYSLGATVYELLTGTPPFFRGGIDAVRGQIKDEPPTPIMERRQELVDEGLNRDVGQTVCGAFAQTVMDCLAKEREKRPASPHALREAITGSASRTAAAPASAVSDDAEARKHAALNDKRKEEERQMAEERKRAREAQAQAQRHAAAPPASATTGSGHAAPPPAADDIYAEYLAPNAGTAAAMSLRYLPVSSRGTWKDRKREADNITRHLSAGMRSTQAASSSVAAMALTRRHRLDSGAVLCCEVRPDHVCCSWLDIGDGVYEERASWAIDSAGLGEERLAARVWGSCEGMRTTLGASTPILICAVTHACSTTRAQAHALAQKLPHKVWLWEDELPAALAGAQTGPHQSDTLLLSAIPHALSVRLPDQSLMPVLKRFTCIPTARTLDLSWPADRDLSSLRLELVEETDHGVVPVTSQALRKAACAVQNGSVQTWAVIDVDASWHVTLSMELPAGMEKTQAPPQKAPAQPSPKAAPRQPAAAAPPAAAAATPEELSNATGDRIATIITVVVIAGTFVAALLLWPDWKHFAYWRNGCWVWLIMMLCACGAEKDGDEISKRLLGPVVVTLIAALLFTFAAWMWPGKTSAASSSSSSSRRFSESKVFTGPSSGPGLMDEAKAEAEDMPAKK